MKRQLIELNKLDELLVDFKQMKNKGESFSEFISVSKTLFDDEDDEIDKRALFDWVEVWDKDIIEVREDE